MGNVAWIEVTAGDRAGCTGIVKPGALVDPKFLDEFHNNLKLICSRRGWLSAELPVCSST